MKKIALVLIALLAMASVVMAAESFSLREAVGEDKDVNINSNGMIGSGYIIDGETKYDLTQKNGNWQARAQVGRVREAWQPVSIVYDANMGTLTIPQLGVVADVVVA